MMEGLNRNLQRVGLPAAGAVSTHARTPLGSVEAITQQVYARNHVQFHNKSTIGTEVSQQVYARNHEIALAESMSISLIPDSRNPTPSHLFLSPTSAVIDDSKKTASAINPTPSHTSDQAARRFLIILSCSIGGACLMLCVLAVVGIRYACKLNKTKGLGGSVVNSRKNAGMTYAQARFPASILGSGREPQDVTRDPLAPQAPCFELSRQWHRARADADTDRRTRDINQPLAPSVPCLDLSRQWHRIRRVPEEGLLDDVAVSGWGGGADRSLAGVDFSRREQVEWEGELVELTLVDDVPSVSKQFVWLAQMSQPKSYPSEALHTLPPLTSTSYPSEALHTAPAGFAFPGYLV